MIKKWMRMIGMVVAISITILTSHTGAVYAAPEEDGEDTIDIYGDLTDQDESPNFDDIFEMKFENELEGEIDVQESLEVDNFEEEYEGIEIAYEDSNKCGDNISYTFDNGILTISGSGGMYNYDYENNKSPFCENDAIEQVIIEDGVTNVGEYAFYLCKNIKTVEFPASLLRIDKNAFSFCNSLTSITIPSGVAYIGVGAFSYCSRLSTATITGNVTVINKGTFFVCNALRKVYLPASITIIDESAFGSCANMREVYFAGSTIDWKKITVEKNNEILLKTAIHYEIDTPDTVEDPENDVIVVSGPAGDYSGWTLYESGLLFIRGEGKLDNRSLLTSEKGYSSKVTRIEIDDGITEIGSENFKNFTNLASVRLPKTLKVINSGAFANCGLLQDVVFPDGVETVGGFNNCSSISNVVLPNSVKKIDIGAFSGCSSISKIVLPDTVEYIGIAAFSDCSSIKSVYLPENRAYICDRAFENCDSMEYIYISARITDVGEDILSSCNSLRTIYYSGDEHSWSCRPKLRSQIPLNYMVYDSYGPDAYLLMEDGNLNCYQKNGHSADFSGFAYYDYENFFVVDGKIDGNANGLVNDINHPEDWYYCSAGLVQSQYTGLAQYDGKWFYINKGKLDTTLADYVEYDGGLFFVGAGRIMTEVNGLAKDPDGSDWYYLANGQAQIQYTGLAQYDGEWFYVVKGKLAENYTGKVDYDGAAFNVVNGMVVEDSGNNTNTQTTVSLGIDVPVFVYNKETEHYDDLAERGALSIPGLNLTTLQSNIWIVPGPMGKNDYFGGSFSQKLTENQIAFKVNASASVGEKKEGNLQFYYSFIYEGKTYTGSGMIKQSGVQRYEKKDYPLYSNDRYIVINK